MSVDGNWSIKMNTPMGERSSTVALKSSGDALSGTQSAEGNSGPIQNGKVSGNDVSWSIDITNPMPLTLEFKGTVNGDAISGDMSLGMMGSFPFSGTRA